MYCTKKSVRLCESREEVDGLAPWVFATVRYDGPAHTSMCVKVNVPRIKKMNHKFGSHISVEQLGKLLGNDADVTRNEAVNYVLEELRRASQKHVKNCGVIMDMEAFTIELALTHRVAKIGKKAVPEWLMHNARMAGLKTHLTVADAGPPDVLEVVYFEPRCLKGYSMLMQWCGTGPTGMWLPGPETAIFGDLNEMADFAIKLMSIVCKPEHMPRRYAFTRMAPDTLLTINGQGPWERDAPTSTPRTLRISTKIVRGTKAYKAWA